MSIRGRASIFLAILASLTGCDRPASKKVAAVDAAPSTVPEATPAPGPGPTIAPADTFLARIARHCGQAFAGRVVANQPPQADDTFAGKSLIMHIRECRAREIRIPFHVGDDHSRTWVLTRTDASLRLKHDHRHADGSEDAVTMYGGDATRSGSELRQEFPIDAESIALFEREGLSASVSNTWAMEIEPGQRFLYELSRPGGRLFQIEFDLTAPVPTPPTPWGHPELP